MKKQLVVLSGIVVLFLILPLHVHAGAPLETIQGQVGKVLDVLRDPALKGESARETKEKQIWMIISSIFDYTELSRRTLSRDWKKFSPEQQEEFAALFGRLLGSVYMDRLMKYSGEKVVFSKEIMLSEKRAEVQSEIITSSGSTPIHYRMILGNGQWKVYDVVVEGISLIKNYRSQFRGILAKKSPEQLLEMLRKKVGQA